ncbi:calcium uptake protein 3, mitochondrial isoform X4 [Drosophila sulfurigaster albostrigata]|uniref:calcium uptake protein 3, mitochondrial isoform X4 n=1 Tax=Drosophila sulfurigaster albostrigata TaxID=89887 RepID=UPI002D21BD6B|nr:calcium uptake protein 3, mitochondrial isoform X4 [Drosophila sulfurigaster albostrigata]
MANVLTRLTVQTSAFISTRQRLAVCKSLYRNVSYGYGTKLQPKNNRRLLSLLGYSAVSLAAFGAFITFRSSINKANAMRKKSLHRDETETENIKLTARERRFIKFASVEYGDQLYMTPQDFLESVVEQEPRPRLKRRILSNEEVEKYKDQTPAVKKGSSRLFRNLRDKGIVSYTEYLFLLSVLTKPKSGFRIAFNMFDTDGNQRVDKIEFLVIVSILAGALKDIQDVDPKTKELLLRLVPYEDPNTKNKPTPEEPPRKKGLRDYVNDSEGLQRRHQVATTLQLHLFGKRGTGVINYDNFYKFMDNLQTEVLELEFNEFSKGQTHISELDFAKILLRYTYLATDEYDVFLERLLHRVKDEKGISFNDFRDFCHFLNNLDDFTIAMRMYTLADRAISKDEFARAAKICTGYNLSEHLIDTVFAIFDADGDGLLHYKEFIAIMKDRLHRGFRVSDRFFDYNEALDAYDDPEYPMFLAWRHRVCRHLDFYIDSDALWH